LTLRYAGARHAGLTEDKIAAINDETSALINPRERAALHFAEKLAVDHHKIDDAAWAELRERFSESEIIELALHVTLFIGLGRFNTVIGLEV
jgi:alkylhydroperoxidase family enzyme